MTAYQYRVNDHEWSCDVATGRTCCQYPAGAHNPAYGPPCPGCESQGDCTPDCGYAAYVASLAHDCPKDAFLDDPITQAYGVGSEMVSLIACPVCDAEEAQR